MLLSRVVTGDRILVNIAGSKRNRHVDGRSRARWAMTRKIVTPVVNPEAVRAFPNLRLG